MKSERFPFSLFFLFFLFYAANSVYTAYLNLYLDSVGLSKSQIGFIISFSTFFLLAGQFIWGRASDAAKSKNTILKLLFLGCAAAALAFYGATYYVYLIGVVTLFSFFFYAIQPLLDNLCLESLEGQNQSYGRVRMGGTIGYALAVLLVGFLVGGQYGRIFFMESALMALCFIALLFVQPVRGARHESRQGQTKAPMRSLLKNKTLLCLIGLNMVFIMSLQFFFNFYPIYFASLGGTSGMTGVLLFACTVGELPCLFFADRVVAKLGVERVMLGAGLITALRWLLLYFLTDPTIIIAVGLLQGVGFVGFNYCIAVYINRTVPAELKASGQTMNTFIATFFSRIVFGFVGGAASDFFGVNNVMLFTSALMALAVVVGFFVLRRIGRRAPASTTVL